MDSARPSWKQRASHRYYNFSVVQGHDAFRHNNSDRKPQFSFSQQDHLWKHLLLKVIPFNINNFVIKLQKRMGLSPVFEAGKCIQLNTMDCPENALLNVRIGLF